MTSHPAGGAQLAQPVLRVRGGAVGYGGIPVLIDVDLDVHQGEVVALLGPNGSGKSTLIRAILGLVPLGAGSVEVTGSRSRLGYVPQRHTVGGGVPSTVEEIVASGRLARRRLLPPLLPVRERRVVHDAIATVGLTEKLRQPVSSLSGGQQRRVLIARALASEPDVLIMDEPFAGVDVPNTEILASMLAGLVAGGLTLVIVTHEIGPIASLVDRTVVLQHGRIAYDGPPTEPVVRRYGGTDPDPHPHPHDHTGEPVGTPADPTRGDLDLGTGSAG